jgi:hypothetical protein
LRWSEGRARRAEEDSMIAIAADVAPVLQGVEIHRKGIFTDRPGHVVIVTSAASIVDGRSLAEQVVVECLCEQIEMISVPGHPEVSAQIRVWRRFVLSDGLKHRDGICTVDAGLFQPVRGYAVPIVATVIVHPDLTSRRDDRIGRARDRAKRILATVARDVARIIARVAVAVGEARLANIKLAEIGLAVAGQVRLRQRRTRRARFRATAVSPGIGHTTRAAVLLPDGTRWNTRATGALTIAPATRRQ